MSWENYFEPVSGYVMSEDYNSSRYSSNILSYEAGKPFPDIENQPIDIVIIGAGYDQYDLSCSITQTPDNVRYWLYRLYKGNYDVRIADFGNLSIRNSLDKVVEILSEILADLMNRGITPIVIGGGKELTYAHYLAYKIRGKYCNLLNISSTLNFNEATDALTAENFLSKILADKDNHLFNYCQLAYQTYLNSAEMIDMFNRFDFDLLRLGEVRAHIAESEPLIRDVDFASVDLGSVKYADAPHTLFVSPNGLTSDEICRLVRYAGLSSKLSSIGFYGITPGGKLEWTDHHLMAQVIWHFIEGFYLRKPESLHLDDPLYIRYHVAYSSSPDEIIFYHNTFTEKWWMNVPVSIEKQGKYQIHNYLIPCSSRDYQTAAKNEVPDRWLKIFRKLND